MCWITKPVLVACGVSLVTLTIHVLKVVRIPTKAFCGAHSLTEFSVSSASARVPFCMHDKTSLLVYWSDRNSHED